MKKHIPLLLAMMLLLACTEKRDSLVGDWVAHKVNVQFDENRSTPALVQQIGEMEKQNRISIGSDSTLVFKSLDGETRGRMTVDATGRLYCDGTLFGQWKNGEIVTTTPSPLGEIVITYRKQ